MSATIFGMGQVYRISLDKQGYEKGSGRYYGVGLPLYACWYKDLYFETRAATLLAGRDALRELIARYVALGLVA